MSTSEQEKTCDAETNRNVPTDRSTRRNEEFLPSGETQKNVFGKFDYEQRYAEDPPGQEVGEYARIWLTYLDETEQYDQDKVKSWEDTIDVLLVFAGLFSGVITTFVIESTQNLQTDYTQVSANLLFELVQIQRDVTHGVPAGSISPSFMNPNTPFVSSVTDSVVNALWFTSLTLALVTALLAVLTKQWLYQYSSLPYGTPRERSRLRQFRSQGLETWKIATIVQILPILMHGALALFLTGLVTFVIPLKTQIAWIVGVIAGITCVGYVVSALLPIFDPQCPYTTLVTKIAQSFSRLARRCSYQLINLPLLYTEKGSGEIRMITIGTLAGGVITTISSISTSYRQRIYHWFYNKYHQFISSKHWDVDTELSRLLFLQPIFIAVQIIDQILSHYFDILLSGRPAPLRNDKEHERTIVQKIGISIDTDAISSLYSVSTNPSVRRIINQSIGALPYGINRHLLIEKKLLYEDLSGLVHEEAYSKLHVGSIRRLTLAWLHYGNEPKDVEVIRLLDSSKISRYDPRFAELCTFLKGDFIDILTKCIKHQLEIDQPLVFWSFLFKHAEYDVSADRRNALARTLLTWTAAENLFKWSDSERTFIPDEGPITLSQLSEKYPDLIGKWIFNYLSNIFQVSFKRRGLDFIFVGEVLYTRYFLFKTIYCSWSSPGSDSDLSGNDNRESLLFLVQKFETYMTSITTDKSGLPDDLRGLAMAFENDIMWSKTFFEDKFVLPKARVHLIRIYNMLRKVYAHWESVPENTMRCIHDYLVRSDVSPTTESQIAVLSLLTVARFPTFCRFLIDLKDPRLDLVLMHSRKGMTGRHSSLLLGAYVGASRNPSTKLYKIFYSSLVLEELCKCMVAANRPHYILEIARLKPCNPEWKICYKHLLDSIEKEFYSCFKTDTKGEVNPFEVNPEDNLPARQNPFHQIYRKKWFKLYVLCYHLHYILDLSGADFTLREVSNLFPQTFSRLSQDQIREFNALVLKEKNKIPPRGRFGSIGYRLWLKFTLGEIIRPISNLNEKGDNLPVQTSPV